MNTTHISFSFSFSFNFILYLSIIVTLWSIMFVKCSMCFDTHIYIHCLGDQERKTTTDRASEMCVCARFFISRNKNFIFIDRLIQCFFSHWMYFVLKVKKNWIQRVGCSFFSRTPNNIVESNKYCCFFILKYFVVFFFWNLEKLFFIEI